MITCSDGFEAFVVNLDASNSLSLLRECSSRPGNVLLVPPKASHAKPIPRAEPSGYVLYQDCIIAFTRSGFIPVVDC